MKFFLPYNRLAIVIFIVELRTLQCLWDRRNEMEQGSHSSHITYFCSYQRSHSAHTCQLGTSLFPVSFVSIPLLSKIEHDGFILPSPSLPSFLLCFLPPICFFSCLVTCQSLILSILTYPQTCEDPHIQNTSFVLLDLKCKFNHQYFTKDPIFRKRDLNVI